VLGWVKVDQPLALLSWFGLAFHLLLAGLEVDFARISGRLLTVVGFGYLLSVGLALLVGFGLLLTRQVVSPLLIAIILVATALGVVVPVLEDAGESASTFGQLVMAGAMVAQFGSMILLTLFFSRAVSSTATTLVVLAGFVLLAAGFIWVVLRLERSQRIGTTLLRLQDSTGQIRVRGALLVPLAFVTVASAFGLQTMLGAFVAGVILRLVDRDRLLTHPLLRQKLEAIGYGVFIPVFYVTSGLQFDLAALIATPATTLRVPILLAALLLVRGGPAFLYRPFIGLRRSIPAGLLQATSLPFMVAATKLGSALGLLTRATGAALIAAGLLSVLLFPLLARTLLRERQSDADPPPSAERSLAPERQQQPGGGAAWGDGFVGDA
jgi:Kef-type K+ transport system membrane component KefB